MSYCPECNAVREGEFVSITPSESPSDPWSAVLEAFRCSACDMLIPSHIANLAAEVSLAQLREEWATLYRPKTDADGAVVSEMDAIRIGEELLRAGQYAEVVRHCEVYTEKYGAAAFWNLQGIAYGVQGEAAKAKLSFTSALDLEPDDATTLANYITACLDSNDKKAALAAVERYFAGLDEEGQETVLDVLLGAVKAGLMKYGDMPNVIRELFAEMP